MDQAAKTHPIDTGSRKPADRAEIARRLKRHLVVSHGQPENCRIGIFKSCAGCRTLYEQLLNAEDAAITLNPIQTKVRIPESL